MSKGRPRQVPSLILDKSHRPAIAAAKKKRKSKAPSPSQPVITPEMLDGAFADEEEDVNIEVDESGNPISVEKEGKARHVARDYELVRPQKGGGTGGGNIAEGPGHIGRAEAESGILRQIRELWFRPGVDPQVAMRGARASLHGTLSMLLSLLGFAILSSIIRAMDEGRDRVTASIGSRPGVIAVAALCFGVWAVGVDAGNRVLRVNDDRIATKVTIALAILSGFAGAIGVTLVITVLLRG